MKLINRLAAAADRILMSLTGIVVFLLLLFSGYSLYDTFYTGRNALVSHDLLQYKPRADTAAKNGINGFEGLLDLNEDAAAWLTVYDTHIDYPVVQGEDNYEYANKDVFGKASLTGALYLSADNDRRFQDNYCVIYGHHMDNGGMFGDIEEYYDDAFFEGHTDGFLQTLDGNYRLTVFAFLATDAYDVDVYFSDYNDPAANERLWQRIQKEARYLLDSYEGRDFSRIHKLIALSTCEDATTNGRIVLFADAIPGEGRPETAEEETIGFLTATGRGGGGEHFALLNLVCVLLNLFTLFPVLWVRTKYRQIPYAAGMAKSLAEENRRVSRDMRRFVRKAAAGLFLEIALAAAAVLVFWRTEAVTAPMVFQDDWTGAMLLILMCSYLIDFICFRYRGKRPVRLEEKGG